MNITLNVRNLDDEHVMMTKESLQTLLVLLDADPKNVVRNADAPGKPFNVCGPYSTWEVVTFIIFHHADIC